MTMYILCMDLVEKESENEEGESPGEILEVEVRCRFWGIMTHWIFRLNLILSIVPSDLVVF